MALFKKKTDTEQPSDAPEQQVATDTLVPANLAGVLISPRFTEKAATAGAGNVYTFNVAVRATKTQIKQAIKALYNVDPIKVTTSTLKPEQLRKRGVKGATKTTKKAMVTLKKGDTINFV